MDKKELIVKALKEIREKSHLEIETETAYKWAARAIASFLLSKQNSNLQQKLDLFTNGEDYFREAVEHAGSTEDAGIYTDILDWVRTAQNDARDSILEMEFTRD